MSTALPHSLYGTYSQYKSDTHDVVQWLARAAQRCGYALSTLPNAHHAAAPDGLKLKGRARKLARDAAAGQSIKTYSIKLKDFEPLARKIATHLPPMGVPQTFVLLTNRMLEARTKCTLWFENHATDAESRARTRKHEHFNRVLASMLEILRPRFNQSASTWNPNCETGLGSSSENTNMSNQELFSNYFSAMTLNDATGEEASARNSPNTSQKNNTSSTDPPIVAKIEQDVEGDEAVLICHCFFEDLSNIRSYLRVLWSRLRQREVSIVEAALATNTAIDAVQSLEDDFRKSLPRSSNYEDTMLKYLCSKQVESAGKSLVARSDEDRDCGRTSHKPQEDVTEWTPLPVREMLERWSNSLKSTDTDELSSVDTESPDDTASQPRADYALLIEALHYIRTQGRVCLSPAAEDQFTRAIRHFLNNDYTAHVWVLFAVQIFLDVRNLLGPVAGSGLQQLDIVCKNIRDNKKTHLACVTALGCPTEQMTALATTRDLVMLDAMAADILEDKVRLDPDSCMEGCRSIFTQHPWACGIIIFSLLSKFQRIGLTEGDQCASVMGMVHLYNAMRQEGDLEISWQDMDFVIKEHTPQKLFVGAAPTAASEYGKHLDLAMGVSYVRQNTSRAQRELAKGYNPVSRLLQGRILQSGLNASELAVEDLALLLVTKLDRPDAPIRQDSAGRLEDRADMWKKASRKPKLKAVELLQLLEKALRVEVAGIHFNYLSLAGRCLTLLAYMASMLQLSGIPGPPCSRRLSGILSPIDLAPQVLLELELSSGGESPSHHRWYDICVQVLKNYVAEDGAMGMEESMISSPMVTDTS